MFIPPPLHYIFFAIVLCHVEDKGQDLRSSGHVVIETSIVFLSSASWANIRACIYSWDSENSAGAHHCLCPCSPCSMRFGWGTGGRLPAQLLPDCSGKRMLQPSSCSWLRRNGRAQQFIKDYRTQRQYLLPSFISHSPTAVAFPQYLLRAVL